jgi:hypothetical protein
MLTCQYSDHVITFSVSGTVTFESGIKAMANNQNALIGRVFLDPIHIVDSSVFNRFTTVGR